MARGWESKSAEEQMERRTEERADAAKKNSKTEFTAEEMARARRRQLLELKRERVLSEKTSHPARRTALQAALQEIESELAQMQ